MSTNMSAPVDGLASASAFCRLVAAARAKQFPGHWSGSAFRHHPCGVIEGSMKLTNEWNTNDYCSVEITDGDGWRGDYSRDSFGNGDPHPRPLEGKSAVTVWSNGRWAKDEFRAVLEPKVRDLIARIEAHVAAATVAQEEKAAADRAASALRRKEVEQAALAKFA